MANFALILPRPEMVAQAGRIARQLGMKVVLNQYAVTEQILDVAADARKLGADIVVARGLHASILREKTDFPIAEIRLTGLEIARLLHRARSLVPHVARPRVGVVTFSNMVGNIQGFEDILGIELGRTGGCRRDGCDLGRRFCQCILPSAGQAYSLL